MKLKLAFWLLVFTAATHAAEPWTRRVFDANVVQLDPLIAWWTNAEAILSANKKLPEEKQQPLPPRPLSAWVRLRISSAPENAINGVSSWRIMATLRTRPDEATTQKIVLRHAPEKLRVNFNALLARLAAAERSKETNADEGAAERDQAFAHKMRGYDLAIAQPYALKNSKTGTPADREFAQANALNRAASSVAIAKRDAEMEIWFVKDELARLSESQAVFTFETFALRTGETYAGLPVYDLGAIPGI